MSTDRSIAFMTLLLACIFSVAAVLGAIFLPSILPLSHLTSTLSSTGEGVASFPSDTTPDVQPPTPARLLFLGDIMLARGIEWQITKHNGDITYPLAEIGDVLKTPDLTIANFEGTIREQSVQEIDDMIFDTTPAIAGTLADAGIDVLSLSNNHSNNYGSSIVEYTRKTITDLGMTPFGDPFESSSFIAHKTIGNTTFAFIGFHAFEEEPESIVPTIQTEKAAGNFVVVFPHWGNEYQFTPSPAQTEAAHLFIDAGADAIIGAHPHVIQTYENYRGVPIIYSLGNFIFDQDWSVATQQGLMLGFDLSETSIDLTFTPVSVVHSQVSVMDADAAAAVLAEHDLPETLTIARSTSQNE